MQKLQHIRLKTFPLKHLELNCETIMICFTFVEHFQPFFSLEIVGELLEQLRWKTTIAAKEYSRPGSSYVVSREFPPRPGSQMGGRLPTASRQSRPIDILEEDRAGLIFGLLVDNT